MANEIDLSTKSYFVAGHKGMVGSAICRKLREKNITPLVIEKSSVDLRNTAEVEEFFCETTPNIVVMAAARVGGIWSNTTFPVDFLLDNLEMQNNVIKASHKYGVEKLLFLGSSCIYPKNSVQPIKEHSLLTGELESTNQWYAIAKIAGLKLCQAYKSQYGCDFISAMPTNLFGPNDNFDPMHSHVPAALMQRFHSAKKNGERQSYIWGTGTPKREFLHVDDLADACLHLLSTYSGFEPINIGSGVDISIVDFAKLIAMIVGFEGEIICDPSKPDGTMLKRLDTSVINDSGWFPKIKLEDGLRETYAWAIEAGVLR